MNRKEARMGEQQFFVVNNHLRTALPKKVLLTLLS